MGAGLTYRLGRIFGRDGQAMILPVDHGIMLGRVRGLEDPRGVLADALTAGCDGLLISPGLARATAATFAERGAPARLITMDTVLGVSDDDPGSGTLVASVEQAAALGADAVKLLMPWDVPGAEQAAVTRRIATVIGRAARFEIPVMAEPIALRLPKGEQAAEIEAHAARVAMELGADIIKIGYPGSPGLLRSLKDELQLPVVILGGPGNSTAEGLIRMVAEAVSAGANGIVIGRQVWQREPAERLAVMRTLIGVVHRRLTADQAVEGLAAVA